MSFVAGKETGEILGVRG